MNYLNDKILKKTYKNVRKRGKLQYLKDKNGKFALDTNGNQILLKAKGDTVRSVLYRDTFVAKVRDVERDIDGQPIRENGDWKYKKGQDEFVYHVRKSIKDVLSKIEDIVDPAIVKLVIKQKNKGEIRDCNGKIIRHVRVKTSIGQIVKERINFRSIHDYKNQYYSSAGSLPYAIILQKSQNGEVLREMIPIGSFEVAKMQKISGRFDIELYVKQYCPDFVNYPDKKLLKVGQKVLVLNTDEEYERRTDGDFQTKRLYIITQFSEGNIWLKYHLEAQSKDEIKDTISSLKDILLREYEISLDIPKVVEDMSIQDNKERKNDYESRKYRFDKINNSFRLKTLSEKIGLEKTKEIKNKLDKYKVTSSSIEIEVKTPLLKMSRENWNFLYEGEDFKISLLGQNKIITIEK